MGATDPLLFSRENEIEKESLLALAKYLSPWRITWVDQRDDIGRDGFIQLTESIAGKRRVLRASVLTCAVQAKGHEARFDSTFSERVETRHLRLWTASGASPVLLAVWSKANDEIRLSPLVA